MSSRKERRAEMFKARKAARKAGFVNNPPSESNTVPAEPPVPATDAENQPPPAEQPKMTNPISEARLAANQANAKKSHGALTPETKATSAQNHTIHGLARHQTAISKFSQKKIQPFSHLSSNRSGTNISLRHPPRSSSSAA